MEFTCGRVVVALFGLKQCQVANNPILVHPYPLKQPMSSLNAKRMEKMEYYTEVAVPYGVKNLDGIDLNAPKKKWLSLDDSTPHEALRHWLCQRFDNYAWYRDVIVWESLYFIVIDYKFLAATQEAVAMVQDVYNQEPKIIMFRA